MTKIFFNHSPRVLPSPPQLSTEIIMTEQSLAKSTHQQPSYHQSFELLRSQPNSTGDGVVELHKHRALGFEVIVNRSPDPNKACCIGFQTPHNVSNGMQHILEHLVLAGSKEFPVSDPFFTTYKGSFNTHLNASTSLVFTEYEFATINAKELVNLARIYLDAVFHPLLTEAAFRREGWRLERAAEGSTSEEPYRFSGVVYNEMKGALSSPSSVLYTAIIAALFPDTHLANYSGGDPVEIPTLAYQELIAYHREHYHPSRARIYLHGDIDNETLGSLFSLIEEKVNIFSMGTSIPALPLHTSLPGHRVVERLFPVATESPEGAPLASIAWPLGRISDPDERMLLAVLEKTLLGGEASPLLFELIRRGAASKLVMSGANVDTGDSFFMVSGKDVSAEDPSAFARTVREILCELVEKGIPRDEIDAVLSEFEFSLREGDISSSNGLAAAHVVLPDWLAGEDPFASLDQVGALRRVRERLEQEPNALSELIRDRLLGNPESVELIVRQSHEEYARAARSERERVAAYRASLTDEELSRQMEINTEIQGETDTPEALDRIPSLTVSDMPEEIHELDTIKHSLGEDGIVLGDVPSSGISYLHHSFDLSTLPESLIGYAPFTARLLGSVDTTRSFTALDRQIRYRTGGISSYVQTGFSDDYSDHRTLLMINGAGLTERAQEPLELMHEIVFLSQFEDPQRIGEILRANLASWELYVAGNGHSLALAEAQSAASPLYGRTSLLDGFGQLRFLRSLNARWENDTEGVLSDITSFADAIRRAPPVAGHYAEAATGLRGRGVLEEALAKMPPSSRAARVREAAPFAAGHHTLGISASMDVAYIGTASMFPVHELEGLKGAMLVLNRAITFDYLFPEIRGRSGAYGAGSRIHPRVGSFTCYTYRSRKDGITRDLDTIRKIPEFLENLNVSQGDLEKLIVGTLAGYSPYSHPRDAAKTHFSRFCFGYSEEERKSLYREIRRCSRDDLMRTAALLREHMADPITRVVSSDDALREAGLEREVG